MAAANQHPVVNWIDQANLILDLERDVHHLSMAELRTMLNNALLTALLQPQQNVAANQQQFRHRVESIAVLFAFGHFPEHAFPTSDLPQQLRAALVAVGSYEENVPRSSLVFSSRIRQHLVQGQLMQRFFGAYWQERPLESRITIVLSSLEQAIHTLPQSSLRNWDLN